MASRAPAIMSKAHSRQPGSNPSTTPTAVVDTNHKKGRMTYFRILFPLLANRARQRESYSFRNIKPEVFDGT